MSLKEMIEEEVRFSERATLNSSRMTKEGVLKNVHLIGLIGKSNRRAGSKKPYTYKESAIKEAVEAKLYEAAPIYLGHPETDENGNDKPRNPKDKIGYIVNGSTSHKEGVGAIGDIQFNTGHPYYEAMEFWADKDPSAIMMSHVADLRYSQESNQITKISKVYSVDIVINGNTTEGMFKEGVLADAIKLDDDSRRLQRLIDTAQSLMWRVLYPSYSETQKKVLTDAEKAVTCATIAKDLVKELNALGSLKKEEVTMEYKDIKLDDLRTNCPELVKAIEAAAVETETKLTERVTEAVKGIPADKCSRSFLKAVREAAAKNDDATIKELVDDRKGLLAIEKVESLIVEGVTPVKKTEGTTIKKEDVIKNVFG